MGCKAYKRVITYYSLIYCLAAPRPVKPCLAQPYRAKPCLAVFYVNRVIVKRPCCGRQSPRPTTVPAIVSQSSILDRLTIESSILTFTTAFHSLNTGRVLTTRAVPTLTMAEWRNRSSTHRSSAVRGPSYSMTACSGQNTPDLAASPLLLFFAAPMIIESMFGAGIIGPCSPMYKPAKNSTLAISSWSASVLTRFDEICFINFDHLFRGFAICPLCTIIGQDDTNRYDTVCQAMFYVLSFLNLNTCCIHIVLALFVSVVAFNGVEVAMAATASCNEVMHNIFITKRFIVQVMHRKIVGTVTNCTHVAIKVKTLTALLLPFFRCYVLFVSHGILSRWVAGVLSPRYQSMMRRISSAGDMPNFLASESKYSFCGSLSDISRFFIMSIRYTVG